ncbi:bZIP transcription factor 23-like [Andrographis paniculata]|uniref:bZIP transcription factor 23-like n=1 Tax=Andrographis paniculata TaxID=175694 RepID=UPI0021E75905|nr:bZIP transcription factor 23-like [Andrographis paniculata]XP_051151066.1 bZIP transcription factor 23-like [Andrographis paniculata]XP_051151067.1 bZIP transcription factor 23-like [Andrographis paniculata]
MGSNLNFKNFGADLPAEMGGNGRPPGNFPLARQSSIYSLTFDEFQSTVGGGIGKDLGSMNMDELLKNIWSAEENQNVGSTSCSHEGMGNLQRQGSLTLPRTLSQKTVDEVWNDMSKEFDAGKDMSSTIAGMSMPQKQKTLGEITLEEFLARAGVVREDTQMPAKLNNDCFNSDFSCDANGTWLGFTGYQQHPAGASAGLMMGGTIAERSDQRAKQSATLPLNVNGARSSRQPQLVQPAQPQILPKQSTLAFGAPPMEIPSSGQLGSPGIRCSTVRVSDPAIKKPMVQNASAAVGGTVGLGVNGVHATTGSPAASSDGLTSNGDMSSVSPVPFAFNGGGARGRRSAALEKVVERRQRRMIKNRESAARSRARKQAYTMELEAEVAKLKEENEMLMKKQAEIMEMQKNQALETMNQQNGNKRRCLRRTQTGPW